MFSVWFWLIPDSTALALIQFPPRDKLISFSYTVEHTLGYAMICSPILDRSFLFYKCLFSESWHNAIWNNSPNSSNGSWTAIHKALCCYKLCCVQGELYKCSLLVCKRWRYCYTHISMMEGVSIKMALLCIVFCLIIFSYIIICK